jgi:carbon monoxide dehydrogenase subunit G
VHFTGSAEFVASREHVWSFLIDPTRMGPCLPMPIQKVDDRHYRAQAKLGGGLFSAMVRVDLEITDADEGQSARITGKGGASGTTVEGSSSFALRGGAIEGTTVVDWDVEFKLSGMFAGAAGKVIEDRAPRAIEQLLSCIHRQVEG